MARPEDASGLSAINGKAYPNFANLQNGLGIRTGAPLWILRGEVGGGGGVPAEPSIRMTDLEISKSIYFSPIYPSNSPGAP